MKLNCFALHATPPKLVPARPDRAWMDAFTSRHAYRCLPLTIANTFGWELCSPWSFSIHWNGQMAADDIQIKADDEDIPIERFAMSNFCRGIVTFHTGYIFRTEPGWNLLATGPFNQPKDGIAPLTGIIETDWLPYPFTMNWQLTRPGVVRFEKDEPFCLVFPTPKQGIERVQPHIYDLGVEPELARQHQEWRSRRDEFMVRFRQRDPETLKEAWQKYYFKGRFPDGGEPATAHVQKLRVLAPVDLRSKNDACSQEEEARIQASSALPSTSSLQPSLATVVKEDDEVLCQKDFLSSADCDELVAAFERCRKCLVAAPGRTDGFFDHRFLWISSLPTESERRAKQIMQQARFACIDLIRNFFTERAAIYSDTIQLVKWPEGMGMPVHADNANPDGSAHPTPYRKYASVIYLNDNYEGGELTLPRLGLTLSPQKGLLVAFRADACHEHGVNRVTRGVRYTMPGWYTDDVRHRDPCSLVVY